MKRQDQAGIDDRASARVVYTDLRGARLLARPLIATIGACALLVLTVPAIAEQAPVMPVSAKITVLKRSYDRTQLLAGLNVPEDVHKGRALWLQRCAFCHDGVGQPTYRTMGPWLGAETVQLYGPESFRAIVAAGTEQMPGFRYSLQPQAVDQIMAFLKTVAADQKPTAEQLAQSSSGAAAARTAP